MELLAVVVLPPAIGTVATMLAWPSGGEAACFAGLDLDTPGLVCAPGLIVILVGVVTVAFHLVVALPTIVVDRMLGMPGRPAMMAVCAWAAASWCAALAGGAAQTGLVATLTETGPLAASALVAAVLTRRATSGRSPRPRPSAP